MKDLVRARGILGTKGPRLNNTSHRAPMWALSSPKGLAAELERVIRWAVSALRWAAEPELSEDRT